MATTEISSAIPKTRKRGRPAHQHPKTLQFNIRMSEQRREELDQMCRLGGRPLSYQIEHLIALAKLLIDFCDGNDNLKVVQEHLSKLKAEMASKSRRT